MNVKCEHCGKDYDIDDTMTGRKAQCGVCSKKFSIQAVDESPPSPQPSAKTVEEDNKEKLILGLYRMAGEAGGGGMGKVYRVHHTTMEC